MKAIKRVLLLSILLTTCGVAAAQAPAPVDSKQRIVWTNRLFPAFQKAMKEKKPLVVFIRKDFCESSQGPCKHCRPFEEILGAEAAGDLADKAIWVWHTCGLDDEKKNGAKLLNDLSIESVPALVVLDVGPAELTERGRIVGKFGEETYLRQLRKILTEPKREGNLLER